MAKYADATNLFDSPELPRKLDVLREHCDREGRHFSEIEITALARLSPKPTAQEGVDTCGRLAGLGVHHAIFSAPNAPEVVDLLGEVAPQVR